ncbi:MAG: type III secretion system inner rod subunit SctI [Arsenophonus endosymbiont of Dermacentor nuttalli]
MLTNTINSSVSNHVTDIDKLSSETAGLDDYLIDYYAKLSHETKMEYEQIWSMAKNLCNYSDRNCLNYLQQKTADFCLQVSLLQTQVRKGITAIETLLKT